MQPDTWPTHQRDAMDERLGAAGEETKLANQHGDEAKEGEAVNPVIGSNSLITANEWVLLH